MLSKVLQILLALTLTTLLLITPVSSTLAAKPANLPALNNGLALTPPMGWNSWNIFYQNINETQIKQIADAMVSSGMKDAGYIYLNLDDNWMATSRDANGNLRADPTRFPSGMKALGDYIHSKGLKFGIYGDRGLRTCHHYYSGPAGSQSGSYGNEVRDANTFASWGVDYLKYDNCDPAPGSNMQTDYTNMKNALAATGRSIVYSICAWQYQSWMPANGNLWRTTTDIANNWNSMIGIYDTNVGLYASASPGAWNDPDMLEIGNGGMTDTEYRTHMSLWAIMAAPLIAGNDVRSMSQATKDILMAPEIIAVDQDPLGKQGVKVSDNGNLEIISKQLSGTNVRAVALLNRGTAAANITVTWSQLGLPSGNATVRDLWARVDRGTFNNSYTVSVPAHGTAMLKIVSASNGPTPTPTPSSSVEAETGTLSGAAVIASCAACSGGSAVGYIGNGTANYVTLTVNASAAGNQSLTIYGLVSGTRSFSVSVNGGAAQVVSMTGTSWTTPFASSPITVTLNAGSNAIRFYNDSAYAPDLDRIVVSGSVGPTATATRTPTVGASNTPTAGPSLTPTRTLTPSSGSTNTPTPTSISGGTCSPVSSTITAPFTYDGAGTFCWQSTNLGSYINSWNTTNVTLNSVNITNLYVASGSYPAKIGGYWYVSYNSSVAWAHFEAK
nr:GH27 [uncultured bacterium]